jgi:hypothetical protein
MDALHEATTRRRFLSMGIFDVLRGKARQEPHTSGATDHENEPGPFLEWLSEGIVQIPARGFMGQASKSPDGKYILAWSDSDPSQRISGSRTSALSGRTTGRSRTTGSLSLTTGCLAATSMGSFTRSDQAVM